MNNPILLIDGRNILYRAVFAARAEKIYKYHSIIFFLKMISSYIRHIKPKSVHVFWDAPRNSVWRRKIYREYKLRNDDPDVVVNLSESSEFIFELLNNMNIRQYVKKEMEADDLIFAAAQVMLPQNTVIISADSDLLQIPFQYNNVSIINPHDMMVRSIPTRNPAITKAIIGDKTDNISGYYGIGPKKCETLLSNRKHLMELFELKGREIFLRNIMLTDLSLCPKLLSNRMYIHRQLSKDIIFDESKIRTIIKEHKIYGFESEYVNIIPTFKANILE